MSIVKATTLEERVSGDNTPVADVVNGSARAWVNFNGTDTVAIRASYNVSSVTDNGVGDHTVNFTTAMPNADYAIAGAAGTDLTSTASTSVRPFTRAVGSIRIGTIAGTTPADYANSNVIVFGN